MGTTPRRLNVPGTVMTVELPTARPSEVRLGRRPLMLLAK